MVTLLFTRGSTTKFLPVCSETQPITASSSASLKLSVTDCAAADTRAPTLNHANNAAISQLFRPLLSFLFLLLSLSINAASPLSPAPPCLRMLSTTPAVCETHCLSRRKFLLQCPNKKDTNSSTPKHNRTTQNTTKDPKQHIKSRRPCGSVTLTPFT